MMTNKKIKPIWYDLQYGSDIDDAEVLYTSPQGLDALIEGLQTIQSQNLESRSALNVGDVDAFYSLPFSYIDLAEAPQEPGEAQEWSWKPFAWGGVIVLFIIMLAGYGLFDLLKSLF
jgi:hypothetical protein